MLTASQLKKAVRLRQAAEHSCCGPVTNTRLGINNKLKGDPTRTLTIRRRYEAQAVKRFRIIKRLIFESIVDNDALGLKPRKPAIPGLNQALPPRAFEFLTIPEKVDEFMAWLAQNDNVEILQLPPGAERQVTGSVEWADIEIESAYKKGIGRGITEMNKQGLNVVPQGLGSIETLGVEGAVEAAFNRPIHADRAGVLFTRNYAELKNITDDMEAIISRTLTQGLIDGKGPLQIARELVNHIEKAGGDLGITLPSGAQMRAIDRAKIMARTETIRAHHVGMINTYKEAQVEGARVKAEWSTAADARVCPRCSALEGEIFTLDAIEGLIPLHPQCRCIAIPVVGDLPEDADVVDSPEKAREVADKADVAAKRKAAEQRKAARQTEAEALLEDQKKETKQAEGQAKKARKAVQDTQKEVKQAKAETKAVAKEAVKQEKAASKKTQDLQKQLAEAKAAREKAEKDNAAAQAQLEATKKAAEKQKADFKKVQAKQEADFKKKSQVLELKLTDAQAKAAGIDFDLKEQDKLADKFGADSPQVKKAQAKAAKKAEAVSKDLEKAKALAAEPLPVIKLSDIEPLPVIKLPSTPKPKKPAAKKPAAKKAPAKKKPAGPAKAKRAPKTSAFAKNTPILDQLTEEQKDILSKVQAGKLDTAEYEEILKKDPKLLEIHRSVELYTFQSVATVRDPNKFTESKSTIKLSYNQKFINAGKFKPKKSDYQNANRVLNELAAQNDPRFMTPSGKGSTAAARGISLSTAKAKSMEPGVVFNLNNVDSMTTSDKIAFNFAANSAADKVADGKKAMAVVFNTDDAGMKSGFSVENMSHFFGEKEMISSGVMEIVDVTEGTLGDKPAMFVTARHVPRALTFEGNQLTNEELSELQAAITAEFAKRMDPSR